ILSCPCPMRARLVVPVVGILLPLGPLPTSPTATSALRLTAVLLFRNLWPRPECLAAPGTPPLFHQSVSAQTIWAESANNQPLTVRSPTQGQGSVRGFDSNSQRVHFGSRPPGQIRERQGGLDQLDLLVSERANLGAPHNSS